VRPAPLTLWPRSQLEATSRFRKLLSIERNPPIAEVIAAGVIPRLVQFLQCYDNHALLFEAAWALTNVSSGTSEHTRVVIDNGAGRTYTVRSRRRLQPPPHPRAGAVPVFVQLIVHPNLDVREQALWALGKPPLPPLPRLPARVTRTSPPPDEELTCATWCRQHCGRFTAVP